MIKVLSIDPLFEIDRKTRTNLKLMSGFEKIDQLEFGTTLDIYNAVTINCHMDGNPESKDEDKRKDKEYPVFAYITPNGIYSTSSKSLNDDIYEMLSEVNEGEGVRIYVKRFPSKNYSGDFFRAELVEFLEAGVIGQ